MTLRWATAALKNAYALVSQHQIQLAAAFFLLAGKVSDAVSLLLRPPPTATSASTPLEGKYGGEWQVCKHMLVCALVCVCVCLCACKSAATAAAYCNIRFDFFEMIVRR